MRISGVEVNDETRWSYQQWLRNKDGNTYERHKCTRTDKIKVVRITRREAGKRLRRKMEEKFGVNKIVFFRNR